MAIIKIKKMINEGVDVFKLDTPYPDKEERYMAYNNILFNMMNGNMRNPLIVINEANTGGFIIAKNEFIVIDLSNSLHNYGYNYREYSRENARGLIKVNFEIRPMELESDLCNMNICLSPELAATIPNNKDRIHVMLYPESTVELIEAMYNHENCIGKIDGLFHTLMMMDYDKRNGMFICEHTRTGCILKRLREDFGAYGKIVKAKEEGTFYSHGKRGHLMRVSKFIVEDTKVLDLGMKDISIRTEIKCPRD